MCEIIKFLNSNSGAIMGVTSFMMLVVSGFLAWNARRMRLINEENIKVGIWDNRYTVYSGIIDWHDHLLGLLAQVDNPSQANFVLLNKCNFYELEKYIRKAKLLFRGNDELSSLLEKYEDSASEIFVNIHFKIKKPGEIYNDATEFSEWFLDYEDKFFKMLDDYLVVT